MFEAWEKKPANYGRTADEVQEMINTPKKPSWLIIGGPLHGGTFEGTASMDGRCFPWLEGPRKNGKLQWLNYIPNLPTQELFFTGVVEQ